MKNILVTGGAGYIGSHLLNQLKSLPEFHPVVVDNLSTGKRESILHGELHVGDVADTEFMAKLFEKFNFAGVLHFAGSVVVPESVADPLKYYENNTANTLKLLSHVARFKTPALIFSSTAAVYGNLADGVAHEDTPTNPESPYGRTKLMSEWMLQDMAHALPDFSYMILRYFNVAGASLDGRIGQSTPQATHLLKVACETAVEKRAQMQIYGTDYPTKDGTCIRDFIHVDDLARAHIAALKYVLEEKKSQTLNCGYGHGHTVSEVISAVKKLSGRDFPVELAPRRPGDCGVVMSKADKIKALLDWEPQHDSLDVIVKSALEWERKLK